MEYMTGTAVMDGWVITRQLGEGAYGKVFEIQKDIDGSGLTAKSALKVIRIPQSQADIRSALSEGMDEQSVTSYFLGFVNEIVHEIAIMSTLKSHPNIVSYEDHHIIEYPGEIHWDILIRMELLTALIDAQRKHPLSPADTVRMGIELCDALAFCQRKGMIHRDIKPENIFVSETGQFKLGDFGVARSVEKTTGGLSKKGTESYMAPEVYVGQPYGQTVDIYSLGLVMYRFLNGQRLPFFPPAPQPITFADRQNALAERMRGTEIPAPSGGDERLAAIIRRACAFRPADRYASAAEMGEALKAYAAGRTESVGSGQKGPVEPVKPERPVRPAERIEPAESVETVDLVGPAEPGTREQEDPTIGGWGTRSEDRTPPEPWPIPDRRQEAAGGKNSPLKDILYGVIPLFAAISFQFLFYSETRLFWCAILYAPLRQLGYLWGIIGIFAVAVGFAVQKAVSSRLYAGAGAGSGQPLFGPDGRRINSGEISRIVAASFILALVISVVLIIMGAISQDRMSLSSLVFLLSIPAVMLLQTAGGILRGLGKWKGITAVYFTFLAISLLGGAFLHRFSVGVFPDFLSFVACGVALWMLMRELNAAGVRLSGNDWKLDGRELSLLLQPALPVLVKMFSLFAGLALMDVLADQYGWMTELAFQMVSVLFTLLGALVLSMDIGLGEVLRRHLQRKDLQTAKKITGMGLLVSFLAVCVIFALFCMGVMGVYGMLFSQYAMDAEMFRDVLTRTSYIACCLLPVAALQGPLMAWMTGDGAKMGYAAAAMGGVVRCLVVFGLNMTLTGMTLTACVCADFLARLVIAAIGFIYLSASKKQLKEHSAQK